MPQRTIATIATPMRLVMRPSPFLFRSLERSLRYIGLLVDELQRPISLGDDPRMSWTRHYPASQEGQNPGSEDAERPCVREPLQ